MRKMLAETILLQFRSSKDWQFEPTKKLSKKLIYKYNHASHKLIDKHRILKYVLSKLFFLMKWLVILG